MDPVHQPILLQLESFQLIRIVQASLLKLIQQLLLVCPVLFKTVLPFFKGQTGSRGLPPKLPGLSNPVQAFRESNPAKTIKPATLLTGTGQLLGLTLNGEVDQQRPQIL